MAARFPADVPLSMRELASCTDPPMHVEVLRERLKKWNAITLEPVMVLVGRNWYATINGVRRVWPEFARRLVTKEEFDELAAEVAQLRIRDRDKGSRLAALERRARTS